MLDSHYYVTFKKVNKVCPHCQTMTNKTNGTQTVTIRHPIFNDRLCYVHLKKYRYVCSVCQKTFMPKTNLAPENKTYSYALVNFILEETKHSNITFSYLSDKTGFSVTKIIDIFMEHCPDYKIPMPRVLCIDEIYLGRSSVKKYATFCMDFETHLGFSFSYGRAIDDLVRVFSQIPREQRLQVEYVSSDMYPGFIRMINTYFPKAKLCIDSFHIIKNINEAFKEVIQTTLKNLDKHSREYRLLKQNQKYLLSNRNKLDLTKIQYLKSHHYRIRLITLIERMLDLDQNLRVAYQLKEDYLVFNMKYYFDENKFDSIVMKFKNSKLESYKRIPNMLIKNKEYIKNSFTRINGKRISNGPIESRNKSIKNILFNANGYRGFDLLLKRVFHVLNHIQQHKNRRNQ